MSKSIIKHALLSPAFTAFFNDAADAPTRFAVAHFEAAERALFACTSEVLWLSRHTLDAHKITHPDVLIEDYQRIPEIVCNAQVWAGHSARRYLLLWVAGKPYRAAIKTDAAGDEAWFLSLVVSTKQKPPKGAVRIK